MSLYKLMVQLKTGKNITGYISATDDVDLNKISAAKGCYF